MKFVYLFLFVYSSASFAVLAGAAACPTPFEFSSSGTREMKIVTNNLGGVCGRDENGNECTASGECKCGVGVDHEIRLQNVIDNPDQLGVPGIDFVVTTIGDYTPSANGEAEKVNGLEGKFLKVNMVMNQAVRFKCEFQVTETTTPFELDRFDLTVADMDQGKCACGNCGSCDCKMRQIVSIDETSFSESFVTSDVSVPSTLCVTSDAGITTVTSTAAGGGGNNPLDPLAMTPEQAANAIAFRGVGTSSIEFEALMSHKKQRATFGRNILFSGFSSITTSSDANAVNVPRNCGVSIDSTGGGTSTSILSPEIKLNCIIATSGTYPSRNRRLNEENVHNYSYSRDLSYAEPMLGSIDWVPYNFAPRGYALCNGQTLEVSSNTALFSLLGTIYGGDGRTTFKLPDVQGRRMVHAGRGPGLPPRTLGSISGAETVTLSTSNLPEHTHTYPSVLSNTGASQSFSIRSPEITLNCIIALVGIFPSRNRRLDNRRKLAPGFSPFIGQISWVPFNFAPRGYALCDGQILAISSNTALFALLGTTFGGDGRTTFALPDVRGRRMVHMGNGAGLSPRAWGSKQGSDTQTLNVNQVASHLHSTPFGNTGSTGGGTSFSVVSPDIALNCIIALNGIFPPRNRRLNEENSRDLQDVDGQFLGGITWVAFNFAPRGFAQCDGQLLPINSNQALFSLLGTTYGGDGRTTFALPGVRGRRMVHAGTGFPTLGSRSGTETQTMTGATLPSHNHQVVTN